MIDKIIETTLSLSKFLINEEFTEISIVKAKGKHVDVCIDLYKSVANKWGWNSKLEWRKKEWLAHFDNSNILFYLLKKDDVFIGFFELNLLKDRRIKIKYVALLSPYVGKGYGQSIINFIKSIAVAQQTSELIVQTRTSDHPNALKAYLKAGFVIQSKEELTVGGI